MGNLNAVLHGLKLRERLETWEVFFFFICFESYEPQAAQKFENTPNLAGVGVWVGGREEHRSWQHPVCCYLESQVFLSEHMLVAGLQILHSQFSWSKR